MKSEILKILQMQQDGKLTQDQAAELLAMLADQAREKESSQAADPTIASGAPGPQPNSPHHSQDKPGGGAGGKGASGAVSAFHDFVDAAVGVGATVGRAATVWGSEFINMVHRDEGGNSVTLSKVDSPKGDAFTFRGNNINVSKVAEITLNQAELSSNTLNASKLSHVTITRGRFNQCSISGSSVHYVTIEGAESPPTSSPETQQAPSGLRGVTLNATKFVRVKIAASTIDTCTFQASAIKDLELSANSTLRDSRFNDCSLTSLRLERANLSKVTVERSRAHDINIRDISLDRVTFSASGIDELTLTGGTWVNVGFRRDALGSGAGGQDSGLRESTFDNCALTDVEFLGCTFRRTTLRNLTLKGITIRNIDFTGLILDTEEAFKKAAGLS